MFKLKFPKWFDEWNRNNPTNIFGPAILVGALGGALFAAIMIILYSEPILTSSLQTGPRGTGMSVAEFNMVRVKADPDIEGYQARGDGDDAFLEAMRSWTGIPDLLEDPDNYQSKVALRMIEMTQNLNENWDSHVGAEAGVTCYTCHRGEPVPSGIWYNITPVTDATGSWASVQNRATSLSSFSSLPSSALEVYLTDYDSLVNVHDLESRVAGVPGLTEDVATIQKTEMTYSLMNYFANSLGVNCVFCHNSRAFYDTAQVTPQWGTAQLGRQMVIETNVEYVIPVGDELPENRLGPVHMDPPKVGFQTCHKGQVKPLQGLAMIEDWPELQTVGGAPGYE